MMTIKIGRPLLEFIELCVAASIPPMLIGRHGVGKSESLIQAATALGLEIVVRDLSLMEPVDLLGLPKITAGATVYAAPEFLPRSGKGLFVFEEINRCDKAMRAPCLELLTARRLNSYHLPQGWLPVAAINPDDDDAGYEVAELDPALLSRFSRVKVVPDLKEWLMWATAHGVHPAVLSYAQSDVTIFDDPQSNPRAWKRVSDALLSAQRANSPARALRAAVLGLVSEQRGIAFLKTLDAGDRPLTVNEVLSTYHVSQAKLQGWIGNGRTDLVRATLLSLQKFLQTTADYQRVRASAQAWKNLGQFLGDLPGDLREAAVKDMISRQYDVPSAAGKAA